MPFFVLAALALLLLGMALWHQTLFDADVVRQMEERLMRLTPQSRG